MLTAQVERYGEVVEQMVPLYLGHWAEVALDTTRPQAQLAPRYRVYEQRDAAGEVVLVTLRDGGVLCGYFLCFVGPGLHYAYCLTATMDILYVHPAVRGRFGGLRLIRTMQRELRRRGVHRLFAGEKIGKSSRLGRLFELCGMRAVETYYSIWLGE